MLFSTQMLLDELKDYSNPRCKLQRLVKEGKYTPIVRGLYESDKNTPGYLLATAIRSPSYLSFEYALSYYGFIPERVYAYTSATYNTGKSKMYTTPFGRYMYRDSPKQAFHLGTDIIRTEKYPYWIATKEKAVCDELYIKPPVSNRKELKELLYEDLRIEEENIEMLNRDDIAILSEKYHCKNVDLLNSYLRGM